MSLILCYIIRKPLQPETIPQAIIDMTKVLEVTTAEDVTSHPHSIAITAPERVTFVKGTCPEETKWWFNVLSAFPKSKVSVTVGPKFVRLDVLYN